MASKQLKEFTVEEVARHNKEGDLWIVIDSRVYDVSRFANLHPGGAAVLLVDTIAGKDATKAFFGLHRQEVLYRPQYARLQVGTIRGQQPLIKPLAADEISQVPYAEPSWLSPGFSSPYYNASHRRFQKAMRRLVNEVILPEAIRCEENGKRISQEVMEKLGELNVIGMRLGPGKHLKGKTLLGGVITPEEYDHFHELIISNELGRCGTRGFMDGLFAGDVIGLPPLLNFGPPELQAKIVPDILAGKKFICLAISEAFAGSDVGWHCRRTPTKMVTNGWITNGTFADYFTVACKTEGGYTVILVPRCDELSTKPIKTAYSPTAGTAFVTFDKVRVPVSNTLGKEGKGMSVILSNFNHERWMIIAMSLSTQRLIVEECLKWSQQRQAFGKALSSQAVVRSKLAHMISRVESAQNWLENVTHQMNNVRPFCLIYVTSTGRATAEDATQIFGGRSVTQSGMGKLIENYHRTSPYDAILGGAEDVMGDLGVRQALRKMPKNARL
ncbi:acyl-CoA dehydrogenase [Lactarius deliciosus]|nr:acyl-CoA dehydrogenase [Lactarius deliciosus]